jgi:hypothetical protein
MGTTRPLGPMWPMGPVGLVGPGEGTGAAVGNLQERADGGLWPPSGPEGPKWGQLGALAGSGCN